MLCYLSGLTCVCSEWFLASYLCSVDPVACCVQITHPGQVVVLDASAPDFPLLSGAKAAPFIEFVTSGRAVRLSLLVCLSCSSHTPYRRNRVRCCHISMTRRRCGPSSRRTSTLHCPISCPAGRKQRRPQVVGRQRLPDCMAMRTWNISCQTCRYALCALERKPHRGVWCA